MTLVVSGSVSHIFHTREEIAEHLLSKTLANKNRKIGTEWEMFFIRQDFFNGRAPKAFTREDGQKAFMAFRHLLKQRGYCPALLQEQNEGAVKIIGLSIPSLGIFLPEAGYQFEFASSVCETPNDLRKKIEDVRSLIMDVTRHINCAAVFKGFVPGFAEKTETMDRSRSREWQKYYARGPFSEKDRHILRAMQNGTASLQFTLDSGAEKFHEFYKALLLIEPALTARYKNSDRPYISTNDYGEIIPSQVEPIVDVWKANDPEEAIRAIVNRLMDVDIPFLPDPDHEGLYKTEPLRGTRPPKVKELMDEGRLSEKALNNIGGFFYTRPTFKKFAQALLEIRGMDTQENTDTIVEIAQRIFFLVYNDAAREKLLNDYAYLRCADIRRLHRAANAPLDADARSLKIGKLTVAEFVEDVLSRSDTALSNEALNRGPSFGFSAYRTKK